MTQRDPAAELAKAARRRTEAMEAAREAAAQIAAEQAETLERERAVPVVSPEPLPEGEGG
jgi:uncharacterized protein YqfA (UPF0365 family)